MKLVFIILLNDIKYSYFTLFFNYMPSKKINIKENTPLVFLTSEPIIIKKAWL